MFRNNEKSMVFVLVQCGSKWIDPAVFGFVFRCLCFFDHPYLRIYEHCNWIPLASIGLWNTQRYHPNSILYYISLIYLDAKECIVIVYIVYRRVVRVHIFHWFANIRPRSSDNVETRDHCFVGQDQCALIFDTHYLRFWASVFWYNSSSGIMLKSDVTSTTYLTINSLGNRYINVL